VWIGLVLLGVVADGLVAANALALVFSVATTVWIGEGLHQPVKTVLGSALVVGGVTLCSWEATKRSSSMLSESE